MSLRRLTPGAESFRVRLHPASAVRLHARQRRPWEPALRGSAEAPQARGRLQAGMAFRAWRPSISDAIDEVGALQPQRLGVRYLRRSDVARTSDVLAVATALLVKPLSKTVCICSSAISSKSPSSWHPPPGSGFLVRVEPREVQMGGQPGRGPQVGKDHVLCAEPSAVRMVPFREGVTQPAKASPSESSAVPPAAARIREHVVLR